MKYLIIIIPVLISFQGFSQTEISGRIIDQNGEPVIGANVYLHETYDGTATDSDGYFSFKTSENGSRKLMVSAVGFKTYSKPVDLSNNLKDVEIEISSESRKLDDLVISAGVFEASDEKKAVALKPVDIVTTAGATADIPGVLNTLPGTQTVGEKGRLFVRGGDSDEVLTFIDGMAVDQPYGLTPVNIPSRMRFSPFLFSGTSFSTGGYSAEYGQALSGTLILKTDEEPLQSQTDLSLMSVGGSIAHTHKWDKNSVFLESSYSDLTPYFQLIPQNSDWKQAPRSWQNTLMYRQQLPRDGMLRLFYTGDLSSMKINQPNPLDVTQDLMVGLKNYYHHINGNLNGSLNDHWKINSGISYTWSETKTDLEEVSDVSNQQTLHWKLNGYFDRGGVFGLRLGTDQFWIKGYNRVDLRDTPDSRLVFSEWLPAVFTEADIYFTDNFLGRIGFRGEYNHSTEVSSISPRVSLAYKTGEKSQISLASGIYRQRPIQEYLLVDPMLQDELALHYILNYQWVSDNRTFRVEAYQKDYDRLVKYSVDQNRNISDVDNRGYGMARGFDLFWRDNKTFKNVDYWLSYSFLDTERYYRYFPEKAVPGFASDHNISFVYKHFISSIRSQLGLTYAFGSGRPYHNPNKEGFQNEKTDSYHDLSMNWSYLIKTNFIVHFSITNVLGQERTFGKQYSLIPNAHGIYDSVSVTQPAKRFIFLGFFLTLSKDRETNQIRNL